MNGIGGGVATFALLAMAGAQASQDVSGIHCQGGELTFVAGAAFSANCTGSMYLDRSSVIEAAESISLMSDGSMTLWGTLVAPRISIVANLDLSLGGGLFSGSPDFFPDVRAESWAGTTGAVVRTFGDIVVNPVIHPVWGAVTVTSVAIQPLELIVPAPPVLPTILPEPSLELVPESSASPVPEPERSALMGIGVAMIAWVGRRRLARRSVHRRST